MKRRDFLRSVGWAALAASSLPPTSWAAEREYPFCSLDEALAAGGFDVSDPSAFTTVWSSDLHYGVGIPADILPPIIEEVNAIRPLPVFLGLTGDLVQSVSLHFGQRPGPAQLATARSELESLRDHLKHVDSRVQVKLALGNHDTHADEDKPLVFQSVFPGRPEYHAFDVKGVYFIFLNGGNCGFLDEEQRAWFQEMVSGVRSSDASLVMVCHQPALGNIVADRGIPAAVRETVPGCQGDLWMISGHHHHNADMTYDAAGTPIRQAIITGGNPKTWGSENPGYWVYGFKGGRLAVRVFRRVGHGYTLIPFPVNQSPRPVRLPFEGRDDILWKVLVGEGDEPYLVDADAARCINYWHYTKRLTYRLPFEDLREQPTRLAVLETPVGGDKPRRYFLSPDGDAWMPAEPLRRDAEHTLFELPASCAESGVAFIRVEHCTVGGFAFLR
ncbi:MAG: hypothetical protein GY851_16595 [bacterium]|nr:hypothetical protein [bacterium]